ncbi:MAG: C45 family peptidase [Deltaproteobacteria bacterium]|nr:C45 family peptidase [Deltaproteobacteria bacterium]
MTRVFELPVGTGRERGLAHGESFRGEIAALVALRTYLTRTVGDFESEQAVLDCARKHLPVLEAYDRELYDELLGIAEGANLAPEGILILNHYTDLRDLGRTHQAAADGCSMAWATTPEGPVAGQTWDMHASAMPFVIMMRDPGGDDRPGSWLLSLTGCLGMAGVNDHRVSVMINNLTSIDAKVGVVWSALVRRALREQDAGAAYRCVEEAPVGSGHHYMVCDPQRALGVETSGTEKRQTLSAESGHYVHANHCLDPDIEARTVVVPNSTTYDRYDWLRSSIEARALSGVDDLWERLGSEDGFPRSVCTLVASAEEPHRPATCGALAVNLSTGVIRATAGLTHRADGIRLQVGQGRG